MEFWEIDKSELRDKEVVREVKVRKGMTGGK